MEKMVLRQICLTFLLFMLLIDSAFGLQCYQCDSNEDNSCPSNQRFDRNLNALVDCNSLEAHTPGTFCMKTTQQSPGWRAWTKITRQCGSRANTGVAWGCRWHYEDNGVWKETCYCEDRDGCNHSNMVTSAGVLVTICVAAVVTAFFR